MKDKFNNDTFLARWLNGELSEEELDKFKSHKDYKAYKKIADKSADFQMPSRDKEKGWASLSKAMQTKEQPITNAKVRTLGNWWKYAVAASLVLFLAYWGVIRSDDLINYQTIAGQQEIFTLPDGSTARLNSDSKISFDESDFQQERVLQLQGEAFFSVIKGSSFIVESDNGDVKVLGTSFNVRSRNNKIEVSCYTGKVGLSFNNFSSTEVLNPGDQLVASSKQITQKNKVDLNNIVPGWTKGQTTFNKASFVEVIEEMERQFDIEITYPDEIKDLPAYNGGFPNDDLDAALNIIFSSIGYQYKISGKKVVLSK